LYVARSLCVSLTLSLISNTHTHTSHTHTHTHKHSNEFVMYDELGQIIITAALVRPKPNIFVSSIQFLCVLATPVEIVILGVKLQGGNVYGELSLYPSKRERTRESSTHTHAHITHTHTYILWRTHTRAYILTPSRTYTYTYSRANR